MPEFQVILAVLGAGLLLSASPGPSMLYVLSRSVGQSRAAGYASSIGLAIGGIILAIASALGLAAVFQVSPRAFTVLQLAGGCYLIYLGVTMIREAGNDKVTIQTVRDASFSRILYQGILVELLNPKTAIFFIAFLPQFVDFNRSDVTQQMLILGMLVPLTAIPSDIIVATAGGTLTEKLSQRPLAGTILAWIGGLILVALGLRFFLLGGN